VGGQRGDFEVTRLGDGPIIAPDMDRRMGSNINGPSLIRVPDWVASPLGRYYLYFADHNGTYLRLAHADAVTGPWRIYEPGVLDLADSGGFIDHIASPEIFIDAGARKLRLYFHGPVRRGDDGEFVQKTRVAVSGDGLRFDVREPLLGPSYFRVFAQEGAFYALARSGELLRSHDGFQPFESAGVPAGLPADIRHVGLWRRGVDRLTVFYTVIGEAPEVIWSADLMLGGDWRGWAAVDLRERLQPEHAYEGARLPVVASQRGAINEPVNQLRDPDILVDEDGAVYLAYVVQGERGIAVARIDGGDEA
jgi:hypothetical protein